MARPRASKRPATGNQLSSLYSEVLRLRLQALNLSVRSSRQQMITRLKSALKSQTTRAGRTMPVRPGRSTPRKEHSNSPSVTAQPTALNSKHNSDSDGNSSLMEDGSPSLDDLLSLQDRSALPLADRSVPSPADLPFSDGQLRVLQQTVQGAVENACLQQEHANEHHDSLPSVRPTGLASPLGLQRPFDRSLEEKILRGEYVDFALLLPDSLTHPQAPTLQFRLEDSSPTMVRKKKSVIDSFHKWVDAFTTFMLVVVNAYPGRAAELIKYLQIISRAEAKFKGLTWRHYDEQFRRRTAQDLSLNWGLVDLELWTVTFSGQAKPHCFLCSSPYHGQSDCPIADPARHSPRGPSSSHCFNFNKPSGCSRVACQFPHVCSRCCYPPTPSHDAALVAQRTPLSPRSPATLARDKVLQQSHSQQLSVSTPIDVDVLEHELSSHPDCNFVNCLLNSLRFGTRIAYTGPHLPQVSRNLISASQHPEVVSRNIDKEVTLGWVAGPFSSPPLPLLQCHPIGVVPKNTPLSGVQFTIYHTLKGLALMISFPKTRTPFNTFGWTMPLASLNPWAQVPSWPKPT